MKSKAAVWVMVGSLAVLGSFGWAGTAQADDSAPAAQAVPLTDAEIDARLVEILGNTDLQTAQWGYYGAYSYYGPSYGYYGYGYPYTSYYAYYPYQYPYAYSYSSYYRPYAYSTFYGPSYGVYYYSGPAYVGGYRGCYYW